jgi:hypothetical protein
MKLRVTGLGHSLTLDMESGATIGELKTEIECQTTIPALYQRLLARGKKLDLDDLTLEEVGMKDRTKIMLMRNALYSKEKEGFERLSALAKEIDELKTKKETVADNVVSEMVTRMCCKLDAIETMGSENLRALRKELLRKAENIDS